MERLTSQALDHVIQMPVHLSIPALGNPADDEFENRFFTHNGIGFAGAPISVYPLPEQYYAAADVFSANKLRVLKHHFFPRGMGVCEQPHGIIRA